MKYTNDWVDNQLIGRNILRLGNVVDSAKHVMWKCCICNHEWNTRPTKIIAFGTGCPKCSYVLRGKKKAWNNQKVDEALQGRSIQRIQDIKQGSDKTKWKCIQCNHVWFTTTIMTITCNQGCPTCYKRKMANRSRQQRYTNSEIDEMLKSRNLIRHEDYIGMSQKINWKCIECNHVWKAKPNDVINNNSGCPSCKPTHYSKIAIEWIKKIEDKENISIQHAESIGEFILPNTKFRVDGFCITTNTVYEFYGDVYHGNPKLFKPTDKCHPFLEKTAKMLYEKTIIREQKIKELGYNLVSIWENDYQKSRL